MPAICITVNLNLVVAEKYLLDHDKCLTINLAINCLDELPILSHNQLHDLE